MIGPDVQKQEPPDISTEPVFALDIGTRSIIGIVGIQENDAFKLLGVESMEHTRRAMVDGQIEDIDQTARVAGMVRDRLEQKLGIPLKNVCVAAAGRALKTKKSFSERSLNPKESIEFPQVLELELEAIQKAREEMQQGLEEGENTDFYCVGYSVIRYLLDDYPISTLVGHRGKKVRAEIIATFLPNEVVESLYAAMRKIRLSVASLTLEPIAAMNAIIPQELRLLNLALVDIGAGTSDIAVCSEGSVIAYTMATTAGDELTETIIREYLVDFDTAERIKLDLSKKTDRIEYQDILGFHYSTSPDELMEKLRPAMEDLASVISRRILEVNERPPAAVFLVGGGSRFPGLCEQVAKNLEIDRNKVAVGGNNYMKRMVQSSADISGPEFATPVGIALTAAQTRGRDNFTVTVNNRRLHLFKNGSGGMNVMDVLLMGGFKQGQIIGRSGQSVTYELNGRKKVVRGGFPEPAQITVNGKPASISTPIQAGDSIDIRSAMSGQDAAPTVQEAAGGWNQFEVRLGEDRLPAGMLVTVNGESAERTRKIVNLDVVKVQEIQTLQELCRSAGVDMEKYRFFSEDGEELDPDYELCSGDEIQYVPKPASHPFPPAGTETSAELVPEPPRPMGPPVHITLNGESRNLPGKVDGTPYQFVDMLNYVDIDPSKPQGNIVLRLNGGEASYLMPIRDGDDIEIFWERL